MGLLQNQNIEVLDWRFVVLLAKCWHVIVLIFYLVCERLLSLGRYTMKIEYEWQDVLSMRCQKWYKDLEELRVGSDVGVKKKLTWLWTKIAENTENTAERLKRCRWWREKPGYIERSNAHHRAQKVLTRAWLIALFSSENLRQNATRIAR